VNGDAEVTVADSSATWRGLYTSVLLGRFVVICLGIWLHAVDSLVTATISPAIVDDIGGVAYINWTILLYQWAPLWPVPPRPCCVNASASNACWV
jgi:hypothetical protein